MEKFKDKLNLLIDNFESHYALEINGYKQAIQDVIDLMNQDTQERPKVLTDEQKVCIKADGTDEYGRKIIEHLKGLGGININMNGKYNNYFYYITSYFSIDLMEYIPQGYKEITLKESQNEVEPSLDFNYLGKKIEYNGAGFLIIQQDKESIDIILDGKQEVIMISDIINGKYKIID